MPDSASNNISQENAISENKLSENDISSNIDNLTQDDLNIISDDKFDNLLENFFDNTQDIFEGTIVKAVIIDINEKTYIVDIGYKSPSYISSSEFKTEEDKKLAIGDVIDVFLLKLESRKGDVIVSREMAVRYIGWNNLRDAMDNQSIVEGLVLGKVKGGYAIDISNIITFLPRSQVDVMLVEDDSWLVGSKQEVLVLKMDDIRGNAVVSRRKILENNRAEKRDEILAKINIGDILEGVVKNITDYGVFVDLGSIDGLLHITDISWCRVKNPREILSLGEKIKVKIIKFDQKTKRLSLGMKQLQDNPWDSLKTKFPIGSQVKGKVTNITNYGAFVEIEENIEGLVHVSEMSWVKNDPVKLNKGDEVNVMILGIDSDNHRISLGIKQCTTSPWKDFSSKCKVGDIIEGIVKNKTEFGIFIGFKDYPSIDGLVHKSDITYASDPKEKMKELKTNSSIDVMVLGSNADKGRISLGLKQLEIKDFKQQLANIKKDAVISAEIINIKKDLLEVELDLGLKTIIKKSDIAKDKKMQKFDKYEIGDKIDAKVTLFDNITGKILLSVKDLKEDELEPYIIYSDNSITNNMGGAMEDAMQSQKNNNKNKKEQDS